MTNVQVKLTEFSDLITRYTADFVGREWLVKQVESHITMQILDRSMGCNYAGCTGLREQHRFIANIWQVAEARRENSGDF